ncbi:MAG: winged helix-turn-helix transcriptional regulator, partial [Candidatus Saccharimonadales bacterium]
RLDDLETHGIIKKEIVSQVPLRGEYSLTVKGQDLIPVLKQMAAWGEKHYKL